MKKYVIKFFETNPELKDKAKIINNEVCEIKPNKYLTIAFDDDMIMLNKSWHTHWGLLGVDKLFFDIIKGDIVFAEDKRKFSWRILLYLFKGDYRLSLMNKEKFIKKKDKICSNKHLRIYTTKEIIKE